MKNVPLFLFSFLIIFLATSMAFPSEENAAIFSEGQGERPREERRQEPLFRNSVREIDSIQSREQNPENIGLNDSVVRMIRARRLLGSLEPIAAPAAFIPQEGILNTSEVEVLGEVLPEVARDTCVVAISMTTFLENIRRELREQQEPSLELNKTIEDEEKVNREALAKGITPGTLRLLRAQESYDFAVWEREIAFSLEAQSRGVERSLQQDIRNNKYQAIERAQEAEAELQAASHDLQQREQLSVGMEEEEERPRQ